MDWNTLPTHNIIEKTAKALSENGIDSFIVATGLEAKEKVLSLLPKQAEVMNMTSVTLDTIGLTEEIMESGKFIAVKKKLLTLNRDTDSKQMQQLGSAPQWAVGSVHAITQDGHIMVASNTGSQLPAYAYGSEHVILVVGAQKIVENLDAGFKRIYEHTLVLESERVKKAYGMPQSEVKKVLIINKEGTSKRMSVILVNEVLGY